MNSLMAYWASTGTGIFDGSQDGLLALLALVVIGFYVIAGPFVLYDWWKNRKARKHEL